MSTNTPSNDGNKPAEPQNTAAKTPAVSVFEAFPELKKPDPNYILSGANHSHAKA